MGNLFANPYIYIYAPIKNTNKTNFKLNLKSQLPQNAVMRSALYSHLNLQK